MSSRTNGIAAEAPGDGFEVLPSRPDVTFGPSDPKPALQSASVPLIPKFAPEVWWRTRASSLLWLVRIALDGRGGFLQERPPPVRDRFDLRDDLRFLLRRNIRPDDNIDIIMFLAAFEYSSMF